MAQLMPLPLTVSCFSKIHIGFTFLVPAHLGSCGKRAVKRVCVCVFTRARVCVSCQMSCIFSDRAGIAAGVDRRRTHHRPDRPDHPAGHHQHATRRVHRTVRADRRGRQQGVRPRKGELSSYLRRRVLFCSFLQPYSIRGLAAPRTTFSIYPCPLSCSECMCYFVRMLM